MSEILSSIKVLDLSRFLAGPLCGQILADMGATVFKIEKPDGGDDNRSLGPFRKDAAGRDTELSAAFVAANRGKLSATIDITRPEGAQLVRELAAQCDVLIENHKTGGLAKYGLDYQSVRAIRTDIIYCSVTGFGQTGPYAGRPAFDSVIQAMSGLMSLCGQADGTPGAGPMRNQVLLSDTMTGLYSAIAILGALWHRRETGQGQQIDLAMMDASISACGGFAISHLMNGTVTKRSGNSNPTTAPSDVLRTRDGHLLVVCGNEPQFRSLCRALGREALAQDERFIGNAARLIHRAALCEAIEAALLERSTAEWIEIFDAEGVPVGPVNALDAVFRDPQVVHRGVHLDLPGADGTQIPVLRSPLRFSESPVVHRPPPLLGQHTEQVLREVLGRSPDQIAALRGGKVV